MIKLKMSIEDISEYQTGILPKNAVKIETPQSIEEMMKKAAPIAAVLCVLMFVTMLCKTVMNKTRYPDSTCLLSITAPAISFFLSASLP